MPESLGLSAVPYATMSPYALSTPFHYPLLLNSSKITHSLGRRREILYIGKAAPHRVKDDFFATYTANLADETIEALERGGIVVRRTNVNGSQMYGPKNKLMRHKATGLPVDFFSATEANWWNYLVCRTGPADSNTRICMVAQDRGWKWNPYGAGFSRGGELREMASEEAVFAFVGLPYAQPKDRR